MRLGCSLPNGSTVTWSFTGELAGHMAFHIQRVAKLAAMGNEPVPSTYTAAVGENLPLPLTGTGEIRNNLDMRAVFKTDHEVAICIHRLHRTKISYRLRQLIRLFFYGFIPPMLDGRALIVHGALGHRNGAGVLFLGPSGAGKSTCVDRLTSPWEGLCDDAVLLSSFNGKLFAQPLPTWSQFYRDDAFTRVDCNHIVELQRVVQLHKSEELRLLPATDLEAKRMLLAAYFDFQEKMGLEWNADHKRKLAEAVMTFICDTAAKVKKSHLHFSLYSEFWKELEKEL